MFDKGKPRVISAKGEADLSKASLNKSLSAAGYDNDGKFVYATMDKLLFSNPVSTIETVLEAHGFVANLENSLACLDTFVFGVYAKTSARGGEDAAPRKINEYVPCVRFELPRRSKVGKILQSFYDEIGKYEAKATAEPNLSWLTHPDAKKLKDLKAEVAEIKKHNAELQEQVSALTLQLSREQKSLSRAARALDSQRVLPDNVRICRVERVDLKRRVVRLTNQRKVLDVPTHLLDRVPESQARCLTVFEAEEDVPIGIVFLDNREAANVERRIAELLYVEGESFKARDSKRNEFQVKAVNDMEADSIKMLRRGMKVMVSISEGYVVRFSVLGVTQPAEFTSRIHEQFIVHDIGRNQLLPVTSAEVLNES
jgi:hypothetical protein